MESYLLGVKDQGVHKHNGLGCVYMIFHKPTGSVAIYDHASVVVAYQQWRNRLTSGGFKHLPVLMQYVYKARSEFRFVVVQTFTPEQATARIKCRDHMRAWYAAAQPAKLLNISGRDTARLAEAARRKVKLLPPERRPGRGALRRALHPQEP